MLKVNIQTFAIKINDGKFSYLLQIFTNRRLHNGRTPFLLYFHIYMSKTELQVVKTSKILQTPRE